MIIYPNMVQGSQEWLDIRLGKITASSFKHVLSGGKARGYYMQELCREIVTGEYIPMEPNEYMIWGSEHEDEARQAYIAKTGNPVTEVGFIEHSDYVGVSPDGLIGDRGMIEIKCPTTKTHSKNIRAKSVPSANKAQVHGQLWVAEREWCDFVSYDPRHDEKTLHIARVERDDTYIERIRQATDQFIDELQEMLFTTSIETYYKQESNMPTINDLKSSKFLKKEDVGEGTNVTIKGYAEENVALETQAPEMKWCLTFEELDKPLVLNQTNGIMIGAILGSENFDDWVGGKVQLYNNKTIMYAGKLTGGVRVREVTDTDLPF